MNYDLISSLARMRSEELLRAAAMRRAIDPNRPKTALRRHAAGAVRRLGFALVQLGDAVAGSPPLGTLPARHVKPVSITRFPRRP